MILLDVREILKKQGPCTAETIARAIEAPTAIVEEALRYWEKKGKVVKHESSCPTGCATCPLVACNTVKPLYKWA